MEAPWFPDQEALLALAVAVAIGLIVGAERGWSQRALEPGTRAMGLRTFAIVGLSGGVLGLIGGDLAVAAGLLALAGLLAAAYWRQGSVETADVADGRDVGLTTEVAALATFLLGVFAARGYPAYAAAGGALVAAILEAKEPLHRFLRGLAERELEAAIKLLLLAVVVLPLLPDRDLGPDGLINLRQLGIIAVVLASVSFLGYWLVKLMGPRAGPLLFGLAGGLVSSTAVTLAAARLSRGAGPLAGPLTTSVAAANLVMVLRVVLIAGVIAPTLFTELAIVLAPVGVVALCWIAVSVLNGDGRRADHGVTLADRLEAPVPIGESVLMAMLVGLVTAAVSVARTWFADSGMMAVAAIAGLVDVDALTITMARLAAAAPAGGAGDAVASVIAVAVVTNMVSKSILAATFGTRALTIRVVGLFFPSIALVLVSAWVFGVLGLGG